MARLTAPKRGGSKPGKALPSGGRRRRVMRWALRIAGRVLLVVFVWIVLWRVAPLPGGLYMAAETWRLGGIEREWRGLGRISPNLARAVVAAEDARFCAHWGLDLEAIDKALEERERGRVRGASTITQQTAKNVFLWHGPSWTRKGLEAGFALMIELAWGKRRILEVYLNVAEFGEGIFGAEAASRHYFGVAASQLSLAQSSALAAILPNPKARDPLRLGSNLRRRAAQIAQGAETIAARGDDACFIRP
ncbi:monofunctional biosynthetic peptidoglycan transglycosylase [Limibaculum sp. FT325]|uniref:monofunctional biosynthetic peptidoglycan transglycosylase n=1 Tax=Thermohalobaculum sediminis TaxID=2939436 RepID=UPI0020C08698|nr:monofunctional biosynthetic peptidoglycan transglycosylase [Limibaculum sediminis]MCL5776691.1 monofunctional biosynthetic peptidoglycan transglycosylase [Limibaculum sediminis]